MNIETIADFFNNPINIEIPIYIMNLLEYYTNFANFSASSNNIILLFIYLMALFGAYFFYYHESTKKKFYLEKQSDLDIFPRLIYISTKLISKIVKTFYFIIPSLILIILLLILLAISTLILGFGGIVSYTTAVLIFSKVAPIVIFFEIIFFFKMNIKLSEIQFADGQRNNNYISLFIIINSIKKLVQNNALGFSKKEVFQFVILFFIIPVSLIIFQIHLFYIFIFTSLILYLIKFSLITYKNELMTNLPQCVSVEYSSGEIIENLLLYQTTSIDYRFKFVDDSEELIVPMTSIKKITNDYSFELNELEKITDFEIETEIKHLQKLLTFMKYFGFNLNLIKSYAWYRKAVIFLKVNKKENAEEALKNAIDLNVKYIEIAKNDEKFDDFLDENYFLNLEEKRS